MFIVQTICNRYVLIVPTIVASFISAQQQNRAPARIESKQNAVGNPNRLFMFDQRIEIISPGHLPHHLTIENIRAGISNIRNPILASYVAKGVLPYRGLGSGIPRALRSWPEIDLIDDRDRRLFIATIHRKVLPGF